MVPLLSALFIMEPLSLPNQREPCKVEKIVLVPPDWEIVLVPPDWKIVLVSPDWKIVLVPPGWKIVLVPPRSENCAGTRNSNELLQKFVIFNKAINLHSRGPTEQYFYVWEPHRGCCQ